jgi:putative hydroxymethylpyrimidine transport system substrate-binding protein
MIHRRRFLQVASSGAALLASGGRGRAAQAEKMTVVLDWLLNPNHAALFAAQHCGAFARAGLEVSLVAPSDPDTPARLVAAGQADLAVGYGTQINMIDAAGLGLLRIATLIDQPLNTVMALEGGGIRTLADLKGRSVGVSVSGVEDAILGAMLRSAGVGIDAVTVVKVNFNMVTALLAGRLDAAIGAYRNVEVLEVGMMGRKPLVFRPEEHGVPRYDELIVLARRQDRDAPRLKRFVAALRVGTAALLGDTQAMWRAFAAAQPELDTPLNLASWSATMPAIARDPARLDSQRYLDFQAFALSNGIIAAALPLELFAAQILA